jgi:hypothetical protein
MPGVCRLFILKEDKPMLTKRDFCRSAALSALTAATAKSNPVLAQASADRPDFFKAKDIAKPM